MNDPWDVKSVRQSELYVSCMKINGTPLLPPVLSQECRKEMQYYKLLAKEVEKRIKLLKHFVNDSDSSTSVERSEQIAVQYEQKFETEHPVPSLNADFDVKVERVKAIHLDHDIMTGALITPTVKANNNLNTCNNITSNITVIKNTEKTSVISPKVIIDLSVSINSSGNQTLEKSEKSSVANKTDKKIEIPEKDVTTHETIFVSTESDKEHREQLKNNNDNKETSVEKIDRTSYFPELTRQDGPSSLSSKSFTGSLNDIYTENVKGAQSPKLIRQRSYTVLEPSPQLMAHLEVQSISKGVDLTSISMSESCSNVDSPVRKRRSWDLETAKVKWSSMAMELNKKKLKKTGQQKSKDTKPLSGQANIQSPTKSVIHSKIKGSSENQKVPMRTDLIPTKSIMKSESCSIGDYPQPIHSQDKEDSLHGITSNPKSYVLPKRDSQKTQLKDSSQGKTQSVPITSSVKPNLDDPATRVRELYEKVQKQQLMQMATLVEKQKREQILLQQMFNEQNSLLYKQLKTICPKQPIEAKEAWAEKTQDDADRGPVSLSQLISHKESHSDDPEATLSTLTDTSHYIDQCEAVLRKSKNISNNFKRSFSKVKPKTVTHTDIHENVPPNVLEKINSPHWKSAPSQEVQYNTTADKEYEDVILTDRTNDTMADLNFTLTSDDSDPFFNNDKCTLNAAPGTKDWNVFSPNYEISVSTKKSSHSQSTNQKNSSKVAKQLFANPTPKECEAATKIVAYSKGYLVRRLMRTERVQTTVQTIRDALVCALQLHTDQAGIRGADVDLHRRLIQQITAACYNLHETFVLSSPADRCAIIATDRARKRALASRLPRRNSARTPFQSEISAASGACPADYPHFHPAPPTCNVDLLSTLKPSPSCSENFSEDKHSSASRTRHLTKSADVRRRPWR